MLNGFALNSATLNGSGVVAQYVYLPSSTMTMDMALAERRFVSLSGSISSGLSLAGDLSRVANIGSAPMTWTYDQTGSLSRVANLGTGSMDWAYDQSGTIYTGITFGYQTLSVAMAATGTMGTVMLIPGGQSDWASTWSGSILLTGGLAGSIDMESSVSGTPRATIHFGDQSIDVSYDIAGLMTCTQRMAGSVDMGIEVSGNLAQGQWTAIGAATLGMGMDTTGDLRGTFRMPGAIDLSLDISGDPQRKVYIGSGSIDMAFDLSGLLSRNTSEQDIDQNTFVRPYSERTWTRQ